MAHREPDGVLHMYVALKKPEPWFRAIDFSDRAKALAKVAGEFEDWAPELKALITDSDTDPVPRPLYGLPTQKRWSRVPGVALLGDAAHLMAPTGEGANLAMFDGAELGKAIAANPDNVEAALTAYETEMFPRSHESAVGGEEVFQALFGDNAPQSIVDFFNNIPSVK
jgi:2-polyprenyl-6-methoxyphenol hydroxylase-like FAD-dependent oxidoreductase